MKKVYSKITPEKLLHVVYNYSDVLNQETQRVDLSENDQFIQVAALKMQRMITFKPHQHIWRDGEEKVIPQETWIVIKGIVEVYHYDTDGTLICTHVLSGGDCTITYEGGHTYRIMSDDTIVYEVKSARYYGQEKDKVFI